MKNILVFLFVFASPSSSFYSATEFLGFLKNGQYCYFRNTIVNTGSYYTDTRCKEFVVRDAKGTIIRTDTVWTEERTTSEQKENSVISRKYKSTFNVFKFLADNKVSLQENSWANVNLYDKKQKRYTMLRLELWQGDLYLHSNINDKIRDTVLVCSQKENAKNIVAHLDNTLVEYETKPTSTQAQIKAKTDIVNTWLYFGKPKIEEIFYYNKIFLIKAVWGIPEQQEGSFFDTYFTISEDILENSLEKLNKKIK